MDGAAARVQRRPRDAPGDACALTDPETAIRARRKLTNRLIAAREAARLRPFLASDIKLISGEGGLIMGADAVVEAFAGQFRDPSFVNYVRITSAVLVDADGARAAEHGDWTALWRQAGKETTLAGTYLAVWRKATGQWVLESELYVTLR